MAALPPDKKIPRVDLPAKATGELTFVHDRFFDPQARDNHERGWNLFFTKLDQLLET